MKKYTVVFSGSMPWNQLHLIKAIQEYAVKTFHGQEWEGGEVLVIPGIEDKLEHMFRLQQNLMGKYGVASYLDIDSKHGQEKIRLLFQFIIEELCEASHLLKNKPWRKTFTKTNLTEFLEEMVDALHFFIELCICTGIGSNTLYNVFLKKHKINTIREGGDY